MRLTHEANKIIIKQGDQSDTIYLVEEGELLVFVVDGSKVSPVATIGPGEMIGEMAFFAGTHRAAYVMTKTPTTLMEIDSETIKDQIPDWLFKMTKNVVDRIHHLDKVIAKSGIKRKKVDSVKPLSIEEQRSILDLI
ncbi:MULTISPECIES: cyclic nucleotide-binding domain-containing protein [Halobacteriovorax]|uniref:Cyclic nucleotide-binding domain-containing protein n=1 Tax=Halobacteriovorax vibrionivorans TaxID=2152716 RepID=A0ABY0ID24_9BACT|nr:MULTISPECIES: cyclic nucleotide-binding domain-containing protein [Halobacteriovorax]AYF44459.1 cyclic nucleotide-binding domain protein [Halobacteriovorax sp. BALOs_7]RZF20520.1 cyclic nucleotide-binding domain-containing protein [Halobacteriovorax vibrionivorans]TGD47433.1 cyclic nucleotide-binding domain-containing protein [Halobacteriovorax sp. Y22]